MIQVACPSCGAQFQTQEMYGGQMTLCPACRRPLTIPSVAQGPPAAAPASDPAPACVSAPGSQGHGGAAIAAFVCGLLALIFSFVALVPCVGLLVIPFGLPLVLAAVICGIIGLATAKSQNRKRSLAATGLVLGVVALLWAPILLVLIMGGLLGLSSATTASLPGADAPRSRTATARASEAPRPGSDRKRPEPTPRTDFPKPGSEAPRPATGTKPPTSKGPGSAETSDGSPMARALGTAPSRSTAPRTSSREYDRDARIADLLKREPPKKPEPEPEPKPEPVERPTVVRTEADLDRALAALESQRVLDVRLTKQAVGDDRLQKLRDWVAQGGILWTDTDLVRTDYASRDDGFGFLMISAPRDQVSGEVFVRRGSPSHPVVEDLGETVGYELSDCELLITVPIDARGQIPDDIAPLLGWPPERGRRALRVVSALRSFGRGLVAYMPRRITPQDAAETFAENLREFSFRAAARGERGPSGVLQPSPGRRRPNPMESERPTRSPRRAPSRRSR